MRGGPHTRTSPWDGFGCKPTWASRPSLGLSQGVLQFLIHPGVTSHPLHGLPRIPWNSLPPLGTLPPGVRTFAIRGPAPAPPCPPRSVPRPQPATSHTTAFGTPHLLTPRFSGGWVHPPTLPPSGLSVPGRAGPPHLDQTPQLQIL